MRSILLLSTLLFSVGTLFGQTKKYDSLESIIVGSISIYKSASNFYAEKNDSLHLLAKSYQRKVNTAQGERLLTVYPFRGTLNLLLIECKNIESKVNNTNLNESDLINLLNKYFSCTGEKASFVESKKERTAIKIGAHVGFQLTPMSVYGGSEDLAIASFDPSTSFLGGVSFEFTSLKSKIGFGGQINFTKYDFEGSSSYYSGTTKIENSFFATYNQFQSQIFFKKYFSLKSSALFLKIGPSVNFNWNFDQGQARKETLQNGSEINIEIASFFEGAKYSLGVHGGLGLEKKISDKLFFETEIRIELFNTANNLDSDATQLDLIFITAQTGLKYRLK